MLRVVLLLAGLGAALSAGAAGESAAPGGWQGTAPALLVARSDVRSCTQPMQSPALAVGRRLASVAWQFAVPAGAGLRAWLCDAQRCQALPGNRGRTRDFGGGDAGQSLRLCFRLDEGARPARVSAVQLLVEYR